MSIAELLKKKRQELGLTQREMGEYLGKNYQTYQRWERGHFKPSVPSMIELSKKLEIDLQELIKASQE